MTTTFETYGGSQSLTISSDTQLSATHRLWVIDPTTSGLAVRLPDARGYIHAKANPGIGTGGVLTIANHNSGASTHSIEVKLHSGATFTGGVPLSIPHQQFLSFISLSDSGEDGSWSKWPASGAPSFGRAIAGGATGGRVPFLFTFNTLNTDPLYLPDMLTDAGWNGSSNVDVTVVVSPAGVLAADTPFGAPRWALDTGTVPGGSSFTLINEGTMTGRGGPGGIGANVGVVSAGSGWDGGPALRITLDNVVIDNRGTIQGGGGGGTGGTDAGSWPGTGSRAPYNGGGGGGGGGFVGGEGGLVFAFSSAFPEEGADGVLTHAGGGGRPGTLNPAGGGYAGGNPGAAGNGPSPGAAGPYLTVAAGVSDPTWINTGTRSGSVEYET